MERRQDLLWRVLCLLPLILIAVYILINVLFIGGLYKASPPSPEKTKPPPKAAPTPTPPVQSTSPSVRRH